MAAIDVGAGAVNYDAAFSATYTLIDFTNPANDTGTLTTIEIYPRSGDALSNCEVATFYAVSTNYSTRDNVTIGAVSDGSKQEIDISATPIDIATDDFIGMYYSAGVIEQSGSGGSGMAYTSGDNIPCSEKSFTAYGEASRFALYGIGATVAAGWANIGKVHGVTATDMGKMNGVAVADIAKVMGVAV